MNNIVIDELKRRIRSMQMVPMKHCIELYQKAWMLWISSGNEADAYETLRYISVLIFRIGKVYVIGAVGNVCLQSFVFRKEFVL